MNKIVIKEKDLYNIGPFLEGVMDLAFDESCVMDKNGKIIHASESSPLIWGRPNEESIGMHIWELDSASPYPELLETGEPVMGKLHIINGRTCITHMIPLFDKNDNIIGAFGVIIFRGLDKIRDLIKENVLDEHSMRLYQSLTRMEVKYSFDDFKTTSTDLKQTITAIKKAALHDRPILLIGETGTGKEILAHGIHAVRTKEEQRPFVRINCNAIPEQLLESELFGYEKGAFPGAQTTKRGKFELAGNGTILLDEIGGLDRKMQAKLLRAIEDESFERVGGNILIPLKAKVIVTTNENIYDRISKGEFRPDLYFRLNTFEFMIPPLRDRTDDIELLVRELLKKTEGLDSITPKAMELLKQYSWPGNVRQLENFVTKLSVLSESKTITEELIESQLDYLYNRRNLGTSGPTETKEELERSIIVRALTKHGFNISKAAAELQISRNTLYKRMRQYGIRETANLD